MRTPSYFKQSLTLEASGTSNLHIPEKTMFPANCESWLEFLSTENVPIPFWLSLVEELGEHPNGSIAKRLRDEIMAMPRCYERATLLTLLNQARMGLL